MKFSYGTASTSEMEMALSFDRFKNVPRTKKPDLSASSKWQSCGRAMFQATLPAKTNHASNFATDATKDPSQHSTDITYDSATF